jgi:hypothetical protein
MHQAMAGFHWVLCRADSPLVCLPLLSSCRSILIIPMVTMFPVDMVISEPQMWLLLPAALFGFFLEGSCESQSLEPTVSSQHSGSASLGQGTD